jgi:hypothetical protein
MVDSSATFSAAEIDIDHPKHDYFAPVVAAMG